MVLQLHVDMNRLKVKDSVLPVPYILSPYIFPKLAARLRTYLMTLALLLMVGCFAPNPAPAREGLSKVLLDETNYNSFTILYSFDDDFFSTEGGPPGSCLYASTVHYLGTNDSPADALAWFQNYRKAGGWIPHEVYESSQYFTKKPHLRSSVDVYQTQDFLDSWNPWISSWESKDRDVLPYQTIIHVSIAYVLPQIDGC